MFEQYLVRYSAPTLAGLKTASLFRYPAENREELTSSLEQYNALLIEKGVRIQCICSCPGKVLIYVYRPVRLAADLSHPVAREHLERIGYPCDDPANAVEALSERVRRSADFPHEVGFFLGYPAEDVVGFIRYGGGRSKCSGCWQVYHDVESAQRQFERIHKCIRVYCRCYDSGSTVSRLTVAS